MVNIEINPQALVANDAASIEILVGLLGGLHHFLGDFKGVEVCKTVTGSEDGCVWDVTGIFNILDIARVPLGRIYILRNKDGIVDLFLFETDRGAEVTDKDHRVGIAGGIVHPDVYAEGVG